MDLCFGSAISGLGTLLGAVGRASQTRSLFSELAGRIKLDFFFFLFYQNYILGFYEAGSRERSTDGAGSQQICCSVDWETSP